MMKLPKGLIYFSRMILHTESIGNNNYYNNQFIHIMYVKIKSEDTRLMHALGRAMMFQISKPYMSR